MKFRDFRVLHGQLSGRGFWRYRQALLFGLDLAGQLFGGCGRSFAGDPGDEAVFGQSNISFGFEFRLDKLRLKLLKSGFLRQAVALKLDVEAPESCLPCLELPLEVKDLLLEI